MNNLITVFMNYKIDRLTEYGVFLMQQDTEFIRQVFREYFRVYVDNYYYGIFHTIDNGKYNEKNLKLEFKGIMEEMLDDYREYELQVSNQEYADNRKLICDLNPICEEIIKIDFLNYDNKDDISAKVYDFIQEQKILKELCEGRENHFTRLVKETYLVCLKLLNYQDNYFAIEKRKFQKHKDKYYLELVPSIKVLDVYRKSMVHKIYQDERLEASKIECLIQKVSLELLRGLLNKEKLPLYFIRLGDSVIGRGKIKNSTISLMDNPLFQKYVVLGVSYNTFINQRSAFIEDYQFACIQDFSHINDIYQKVDNIYQEGTFNYLIVDDYRINDLDFFMDYESDSMEMLMFEEV